jgi:putative acetyltransferase
MNTSHASKVLLETNNHAHLADFIRLNEAWITEYFAIEDADKQLAKHPELIIEQGGYVFTAIERRTVVGTCALFKEDSDVFQLARMAVLKKRQGLGYGNLLIEAALRKLTEINAKKVYLLSNTLLVPALALYQKYGFTTSSQGQHPIYARCNIVLEKHLKY